jgi:hypothetical protein
MANAVAPIRHSGKRNIEGSARGLALSPSGAISARLGIAGRGRFRYRAAVPHP